MCFHSPPQHISLNFTVWTLSFNKLEQGVKWYSRGLNCRCRCMIKWSKDLTFPFKLIAVVRRRVNVIEVQLCTFIQLIREDGTFTAIKCKTDVWSCKLFLWLLAMVYWIALSRYDKTRVVIILVWSKFSKCNRSSVCNSHFVLQLLLDQKELL